ncbi:MAG: hypothetical protein Q7K34_01090 [archaeon]|nr:hypothetical protein [archaeon]
MMRLSNRGNVVIGFATICLAFVVIVAILLMIPATSSTTTEFLGNVGKVVTTVSPLK